MNTAPAQAAADRLAHTRLQLQRALGVQPAAPDADSLLHAAPGDAGSDASSDTSSDGRRSDAPGASNHPPPHTQGPRTNGPTPAAQLLLATLRAWWARHPLHTAGTLALQAANAAARPVAQKHPATLLLGAAAVGAVLVWAKPWRHVNARLVGTALLPALVPGLMSGLVPGLVPGLLSAFSPQSSRAMPSWLPQLLRALLATPPPKAQAQAAEHPNGAQTQAANRAKNGTSNG